MLRYILTNNPDYLSSYHQFRQTCYQNELGVSGLSAKEDLLDHLGYTLIALDIQNPDDPRVAGGVRINPLLSQPGKNGKIYLSSENQQFSFSLPYQPSAATTYCQWSRLAIDHDYRNGSVFHALCGALIAYSNDLGFDFAINLTGRTRSRFYRKIHAALGFRYMTLDSQIYSYEPGFDNLEHLLSITDLATGSAAGSDLNPSVVETFNVRVA